MGNNSKVIELLNTFVGELRPEYIENDGWSKDYSCEEKLRDYQAYTKEEAFVERTFYNFDGSKFTPHFIPNHLLNTRFVLNEDFELIIQFEHVQEEKDKSKYSEYLWCGLSVEKVWNIILVYHGVYISLGKYRVNYYNGCMKFDNYEHARQWYGVHATEERPYKVDEHQISYDFEYYTHLEQIFSSLDLKDIQVVDNDIDLQPWYYFNQPERKKLAEYTLNSIDYKYFIGREIKNGIYRPERVTIERFLVKSPTLDKELLKTMGVHTIQLRADAHYGLDTYFNIKGLVVKAPQKVIQRYGLEKYCDDKELVTKIKADERKERDRQKFEEQNNKFTLMQHGKIIKDNIDKEYIIEFLEAYSPSTKGYAQDILDTVRPIFDVFPSVTKIYLIYWGTFYKYESRGKRYGPDLCDDDHYNKHLSPDDLQQINELYSDNLCPPIAERWLEMEYGWPDQGGVLLGVQRSGKNGKLKIFTEDYDPE